jgi:hypothetical protein
MILSAVLAYYLVSLLSACYIITVVIAARNPAAIHHADRMTGTLDFAREHLEEAQQ